MENSATSSNNENSINSSSESDFCNLEFLSPEEKRKLLVEKVGPKTINNILNSLNNSNTDIKTKAHNIILLTQTCLFCEDDELAKRLLEITMNMKESDQIFDYIYKGGDVEKALLQYVSSIGSVFYVNRFLSGKKDEENNNDNMDNVDNNNDNSNENNMGNNTDNSNTTTQNSNINIENSSNTTDNNNNNKTNNSSLDDVNNNINNNENTVNNMSNYNNNNNNNNANNANNNNINNNTTDNENNNSNTLKLEKEEDGKEAEREYIVIEDSDDDDSVMILEDYIDENDEEEMTVTGKLIYRNGRFIY